MRLNIHLKALTPISHFGDESGSNVRRFRRARVALPKPVEFPSRFATHKDRRIALARILFYLYSIIPTERKTTRIWDEFSGKIAACCSEQTKEAFISRFMQLFQCSLIKDPEIIELIQAFNDYEFLTTLRDEQDLLVSQVYILKEHRKSVGDAKPSGPSLFGEVEVLPEPSFDAASLLKTFERVPYISGNAVRGTLRDLLMRDWCELVGIGKVRPALPVEIFHQLFTGGTITDSSDYEDLEIQREYARNIPPVGLLGTAIGNGTIQGQLLVGPAILRCKENGTGEASMWSLVQQQMFTRTDTLGDADFDLWEHDGPKEDISSQQMIWHQEDIIAGASLDVRLALRNGCDELTFNCFCRMLQVWQEHPYIGGQSARGFGEVEINFDSLEDFSERANEYAIYVKERADEAQTFIDSISGKRREAAAKRIAKKAK